MFRAFFNMTREGIGSVFRKELTQLVRDPYLVGFIIAIPIFQLLVTGLAIQRDISHVPMIVCNYDQHRNPSVELLKDFDSSTFFDVQDQVSTEEEVNQAIRQGIYKIGLVIPPDYSRNILAGNLHTDLHIILDGTNATVSKSILNAAQLIINHHAAELVSANLLTGDAEELSLIGVKTKTLYNPDLQTSFFLIPGILAIVLHMMTILFTSFAIVRERETGTLEQLMVTPIRTSDLMVGKVLPYLLIGFLDMILTLGVMVWFFSIPISGSFWFLALASVIFIFTSLGIGLLISTACRSQVQAVQLTLAFLLPSLLLTGFVFPIDPMPWFIQAVSYALPLTYYLDIIRGVVIKGTGLFELWYQTLVLLVFSGIFLGASILRFKKQVA